MPAIRVCHILKSRDNAFGGLAVAVSSLCQSLQTLGVEAKIAPCIDDAPPENPEIKSVFFKTLGGIQQKLVFPFKIIWFLCRSRPEVIHSHGIWLFIHYVGHRVAKSTKRPHVISVHGMLSKWALSRSKIKKFLAWNLFQKRALSKAACLHATSDAEVEEIRSLGIRTPIVLAPNGVRIPPPIDHSAREVSATRPLRMALFLSRIHAVKGLPILLKAWSIAQPTNWRLVIAGPGSDSYISELNKEIESLKLTSSVSIIGPKYGAAKDSLYREASLFVLPTYSENFGLVVAEALAYEVPVITTTGTPWSELKSHNCGWWVDANPTDFSKALVESTSSSPALLRQMGARGRQWVEKEFSWEQQSEKILATYEWLVREKVRPNCINLPPSEGV